MSGFRASLALAYLLCLYLVALSALGFWSRYTAPIWQTTLSSSRTVYDLIGGVNILLGLAVAYGLARRYEWARVSCIALSLVVVSFKAFELVRAMNMAEAIAGGLLALATAAALMRPGFRAAYLRQ